MNLKNVLFWSVVMLGMTTMDAQKLTLQQYQQLALEKQQKIVKQSLQYNDVSTAIQAMHSIIAIEGNNSSYKDSLVNIYYNTGNLVSAHLLAKELIAKNPADSRLLEINAYSLQSLGDTKGAISAFEKLISISKNQSHAFQLAYLQFGIKRLAEAQATITQALNMEEVKGYVNFPSIANKDKAQQIPLRAALYNLQGLIAYDLKNNALAEESFKEALKIMPEFEYALQSLSSVQTMNQSATKNK